MNPNPATPHFVMSEEEYNAILKSLMDRRVTHPCSRCGHNQFELHPSYTTFPMLPDYRMASSYGPYLPCAIVACKNCGHLSFHSLAHLGLLEGGQRADGQFTQNHAPQEPS